MAAALRRFEKLSDQAYIAAEKITSPLGQQGRLAFRAGQLSAMQRALGGLVQR